jgi:hypothetical protein
LLVSGLPPQGPRFLPQKQQNHSNFDGDGDRVPVYGRTNYDSAYGEPGRIICSEETKSLALSEGERLEVSIAEHKKYEK